MAWDADNTSSSFNRIEANTSLNPAGSMTVFCKMQQEAVSNGSRILTNRLNANQEGFLLLGTNGVNDVRFLVSIGGSFQTATTGTANVLSAGWNNVLVTFVPGATDVIKIYVTSGITADGTTSGAFGAYDTSVTNFTIGNAPGGADSLGFDKGIADVACWDRELTAGERSALLLGNYSPEFFPESRSFYAPLVREIVDVHGATLTQSGGSIIPQPTSIHQTAQILSFPSSDTTPPSLTNPTGTKTGSSTATGTIDTNDANGTMYAVADQSGTKPSVAQIQLGQGSDGLAGDYSANQAISSTGTKTFLATGLPAATTEYFFFQHKDAAGNNSTVSASTGFTTDAFSGSNDISWKLFDTLSENLAWKLFSDSAQSTAYSIFNDASQAVAARIFTELSNATGWKLFSEGSQASGAKILAESTVDSAWSIFSSSSSQDIAWAILTSGAGAQSVAWRIVNALQQDTAARILNDAQRSSSWAILSGLSQDVGWGILTTAQQDALWKILTSGSQSSGWPILNKSSQASSWGILVAQLQASGWKIYSEGALDSAWNIDGVQKVGSIILKAQSRDNYILEAKDRALIVDAKNRVLIIKAKPLI